MADRDLHTQGKPMADPDSLRPGNDRCVVAVRVVWWDLGNHGRPPFAGPGTELVVVRNLSLFREVFDSVDMAIVEAHDLRKERTLRSLSTVLDTPGRPPVLLITAPDPDNMRLLIHVHVDDLAWTFEPAEEVMVRGLRLARRNERRRVAESLLGSCSERTTVEPIVKASFCNPRPPSKVQDLARACFMSRRTLERRWRSAWSGNPPFSLKVLVDWGLLLWAADRLEEGLRVDQIARALGIHKRTLDRIAGRLAGLSPRRWISLENRMVLRAAARGPSEELGSCRVLSGD